MSTPSPPLAWNHPESPFHPGELVAQERAGVSARADLIGRHNIRDSIPLSHRLFLAELSLVLLSGQDATGQPWVSLRTGLPGFVSSPNGQTLLIEGQATGGDPLAREWRAGSLIGMLGFDPPTRRRNRINGVITSVEDGRLVVSVTQCYGNCPQYIQSRTPTVVDDPTTRASGACSISTALNEADQRLLACTDTFFIASANPSMDAGAGRGADISHRGGKPGFIRVDDDRTLTTPDFSGNSMFNTIGNLVSYPRAGLLVVDFDTGDLLHLAAAAEIIWDGPEVRAHTGAERLVRFRIREVRRAMQALPLQWSKVEYSPQLARTGTWI
jgi:predicted pyridoxine 5'-phosphate oxidase superfamily flavin-nucleotide-binding protein